MYIDTPDNIPTSIKKNTINNLLTSKYYIVFIFIIIIFFFLIFLVLLKIFIMKKWIFPLRKYIQ